MSQNQWNKPAITSYQEEKRSLSSDSNLFGFAILGNYSYKLKYQLYKKTDSVISNTPSSLQIR